MKSFEFTTVIKNGVIHLPKEFEEYENAIVRVKVEFIPTEEGKKFLEVALLIENNKNNK